MHSLNAPVTAGRFALPTLIKVPGGPVRAGSSDTVGAFGGTQLITRPEYIPTQRLAHETGRFGLFAVHEPTGQIHLRGRGMTNSIDSMDEVTLFSNSEISLADMKPVLEEAADSSEIRVQWIADLVRDTGSEAALALLKDIIELRCESIVGITLGGSEHSFPPAQFSEVYSTAREHGLRLTVHAGEALGPESVWDALSILGTERVGHGVRAIEDSSLVSYLAEKSIPLEVCPTSNLQTGIYSSYDAHPVKELYEAGVSISISSDDPTFFGTTLTDELIHVHTAGVPKEGVFDMIRNGFTHSFLPGDQIGKYVDDLERAWAAHYPEA